MNASVTINSEITNLSILEQRSVTFSNSKYKITAIAKSGLKVNQTFYLIKLLIHHATETKQNTN